MLRGAGAKQPPSVRTAAGSAGRGVHRVPPSPFLRRQQEALDRQTAATRVLGFCGWVVAGGAALFAMWELGNCSVLIGNAPLFPAAVREEAPPSGAFRPAGESRETGDGCTQAPIDRSSGQTTPADCHTWAAGRETLTAQLSRPGSSQ
jgi:hypothetical protein